MNPDSETADGAAAPDDETTARGARGGARSSGAGEETHAPRARSSGLTDPDDGTEAWRRPRATAATPAPSPAPDAASAETEGGARSPRRASPEAETEAPLRRDTPTHAREPAAETVAPTASGPDSETAAGPPRRPPAPATEPGPPRGAASAGGTVGGYVLGDELARGGMGVVYVARDPALERDVAIKLLKAGEQASAAQLARFRREAQAASRLRHPNLVSVHEVGEHAGQSYLVMDLIRGRSLARALEDDGPLGNRAAAELGAQLADALQHAHEHAILHRDVKPGNVLLDGAGAPWLTDFGLAKDVGGARDVTVSGEVLGTPSYMAPEQAAGDLAQIDRRADVYGLGATLYAALAGRAPFAGGSVLATLEQVAKDEPTPPRKLNPAVDLDLETICLRCLEKDPAERYPTAGAVRDDLRRFLAERPILARRYGLRDLARKWLRRNRTLAGVSAGLIGLALAVIVAGSVWFSLRLSAALEAAEHSAAEARLEAERAEQERERAQRAERLAEAEAEAAQEVAQIAAGTLGQLALEVHEELSHLPGPRARELRRRIAEHTRADLEQLRAAGVGGPTLSQLEVLSLQQQVETLEEDKADTEALALGLEAVARSRALLDALPADADLEQSLAFSGLLARSLDGAGSMQLSAGNAAAGRALLEEGLALRRADLARSPDDPGLLQNLAVSLRSVAELDEAEGKLAEALPLHEQWLTVCERVEANSPQSLRFAYETCLARCGLANLRAQTGDAPRAREAFARAAEALRALLERDPTDHASRKLLAQCLIGQADVERWQHHEERALELQVQALEESRRLLREDPTDEARWAVARALYALGITRADLERFAEARAALGEANAVFAELVEGEPEDLVKRQGWASCLGQEASLALATGDLVAAREGFTSAAREFVALLDLRPAEGQLRRNLGVLQAKLAAVEVAAQDPAQALVHLAAAEATLLPLGEGAAPDVEVVYQLQRLHVDACGLCGGQGDAEAARAHADQALRWAKRFFALTPDHPNALTDLTNAHHRVAQLALEAGDPARGLPHAVEAVRLVEARIEVDASNPTVYRNRSIYLALEARLRQALGDPLGALERCDAAFEHHLRVAARQPELSYEVRTFAWDRVLALAEALKAPDAELVARGLQIVRDYARISAAECHALRGMREGASAEDRATIDQRLTERQAVIELLRCDPRWAPLDADGALGAALDAAQ